MTNRWSFGSRAACAVVLVTIALAPACKGRKVRSAATDEGSQGMASVLNMGDPKVEPQLVTGFYGVEAGAWRWAARQFTVSLRPPFGSVQKGAKLTVKLTIPPVVIEKNKTVSLSATIGNATLAPETYTTPGEYVYVRDVPGSALAGESVRVDFQMDKAMPPAPPDIRELAVIISGIGLESK
jgi:hypothetical protein